ncbi:hypothetical protein AAVH_24024 [Aphelenchoides avenae]|nr:hypothetical protein AAVH_24024 [Aphelenchus avenae]
MAVSHFQRDLSYTEVRRFKLPSPAGAENDCGLIRNYLGNCFRLVSNVTDLMAPRFHFTFTIKMLASLTARNVSAGRVVLYAEDKRLSDYRSMDTIFGEMRINELDLTCEEHRFVELIKTTDFFRTPTVQQLRKLTLALSDPWDDEEESKPVEENTKSKSPLWVSGIYLLRNCEYCRVDYDTDRHLGSVGRKIVQICEVHSDVIRTKQLMSVNQ